MDIRTNNLIWVKIIIIFVVITLFFLACGPAQDETSAHPKYVFLFIGDGMGQSQITAAEIYSHGLEKENRDIGFNRLSFSGFPVLGQITTNSSNSYFTDSAASGTAMASGYKTKNGKINFSEDETLSFITVAEAAQSAGRKIGILSSVSLDHATPAAFFAQVPYRWRYYDISLQMAESGFNFFGGGGLKYPMGMRGQDKDAREHAREQGYTIVDTKAGFNELHPGSSKVWAFNEVLTRKSALPYEIDRPAESLTLADFTRKAITLLDNQKGFFMMVEGGKIDWACHDNDAASAILEVKAFSDAVQEAVDFYNRHPEDTLIVVTADHETGGMILGSEKASYDMHLELLAHQNISLDQFNYQVIKPYLALTDDQDRKLADLYPEIKDKFGLLQLDKTLEEELRQKAEDGDRKAQEKLLLSLNSMEWRELEAALADPRTSALGFTIVRILNEKAGISWGSYSHSASPVPVFALGTGAEKFEGSYDNTNIAEKLFEILDSSRPQPVQLPQKSAAAASQ
jgi:alkaline phosphatase